MLGAVIFEERRDEQERDDQPGQGQADDELNPSPVLHERLVGHSDDGQAHDLGGDEGQARDDPGDPPAAQEKILGVLLLASEHVGDDEQQQHRPRDDGPVESAQ